MSEGWQPPSGDRSSLQQRLPFTGLDSEDVSELGGSLRSRKIHRSGSGSNLSSSYGHRMPTRSYIHHLSHGNPGMWRYSGFLNVHFY
jgi:hypothetical protein